MTRQAFDALLARHEDLERQHQLACEILSEGECNRHLQYRECARLYDELQAVQKRIDDAIEAERAAEERLCAEADADPFAACERPEK